METFWAMLVFVLLIVLVLLLILLLFFRHYFRKETVFHKSRAGELEKQSTLLEQQVELLTGQLSTLDRQVNALSYDGVTKDFLVRRIFDARLDEIFEKLSAVHSPLPQRRKEDADGGETNLILIAMIMDLDKFKNINDTCGHMVGDMVLKEIGYIICSKIRSRDLCTRWGGDEFIVVLQNITKREVEGIAERIRQDVKESTFSIIADNYKKLRRVELAKTTEFIHLMQESSADPMIDEIINGELVKIIANVSQVTLTIGITEYVPGETKRTFLDRADNNLYEGKRTGRNRIVSK